MESPTGLSLKDLAEQVEQALQKAAQAQSGKA
jgi:hypothetical protein